MQATTGADTVIGNAQANTILGLGGADDLRGGAGNDTIFGAAGGDTINGGLGTDSLLGGIGADRLTGGLGPDTFDFNAIGDSPAGNPDTITDFKPIQGDKLNLFNIDANGAGAGNGTFDYIQGNAFSNTAGELRFAGGVVSGDVNGDGNADFAIVLAGLANLPEASIVL